MSIRKKLLLGISLVLVAAVAVGLYQARRGSDGALMEWKVLADSSFSLDPGQIRIGDEVPRSPLYVDISSEYPVTLGFVSTAFRDLTPSDLTDRMVPVRCKIEHTRKTVLACAELNVKKESYVLFILDERAPGVATRNSIHVRYTAQACLANCKSL